MSFGIPATQIYVVLDRFGVGQLVQAQGLSIVSSNATDALAGVPRQFACIAPRLARAVAAQTFVLPFRRVPYADTAQTSVILHGPDIGAALSICSATVTIGVGSAGASGPFASSADGLDGSSTVLSTSQLATLATPRSAALDVTGVTVGNVGTISVQAAQVSAGSFDGLCMVAIAQPPRALSLVPSESASEPGNTPSGWLPGQPIVDGTTTSASGMVRLASQVQAAEQCGPQFALVDYDENATPLWKTTLAAYATLAASDAYVLPLRVMYETVPTTVKVTAWARVTAASGGDVRITVGTTQIVLNAAAVGGVQTLSLEADVDVSAYDEWAQVTLEAKSAVAGQPITVHGWAAIDTHG